MILVCGVVLAAATCAGVLRARAAQQAAPGARSGQAQARQKAAGPAGQDATALLKARMDAVEQAKTSRDPAAVAHASELVIALALRELGQIRLLESGYSQAVALYARSLDFESIPDTRVDLAIAQFQAGHADEAIAEADRALLDDPNNERAFQILGRAWVQKNDYARAANEYERVAAIHPTVDNLYALALVLLQEKGSAGRVRADQVFAKIAEIAGDSGSLHVMRGRAYRDAADTHAAVKEFETAIRIDPQTPHAHYFLGLALLAANEWTPTAEVRAEFLKELELNPRDYLANYMMGFIDSSERKYEEGDTYLKKAAELNPDSPEPPLYLGLNAFTQGDMAHAEEYFRTAIGLTGSEDDRANYQIRRAYIDLGRILTTSNRKEEAEKYLSKARELQNKVFESSQQGMAAHYAYEGAAAESSAGLVIPATPEDAAAAAVEGDGDPFAQVDPAVVARANLTAKQKQQADAQEKELRTVLAQGFSDLGTSEAIRGIYAQAVGHYQEAERWDAELPGLQRSLGVAAFRSQNYAEAVRGLTPAVAAAPADSGIRGMLGLAYFDQEKFADAARTFQPLGQRGMQDAAVGYAWAVALARMGEMKQASEALEQFSSVERPNETKLLIGQLWIEIGDYQRAVAEFHDALEANPSMPKAHYFAGQADIRAEHWSEAEKEFQAELALNPNDADAKYNLGFVYLQQSRRAEAESLFQQVIETHPEHASAQYEMGKILLERGDTRDAIQHLEAAARLNPQADFVHYQLQAAYRKDGRAGDADRELEIYKTLKARQRNRASAAIQQQQNP